MTAYQCALLGLVVVVLSPETAAAQRVATSLEELLVSGGLHSGDDVYAIDAEGARIRGQVVDLSSIALSLTNGRTTWVLAETEVRKIERVDSLKNGMWIGAGLTFAGAISWCHLVEKSGSGYCYATVYTLPISLSLGVGLGALFDARRRERLYETSSTGDLQVAPMLTQGGAGARVSVEW